MCFAHRQPVAGATRGTKVESMNYYPFGGTRVDSGTANLAYKFTGQELDSETGLYYYGARYYDATIGRNRTIPR